MYFALRCRMTRGLWFCSASRIIISEQKGPSTSPKCSRNGNLRAACLAHHHLTVSTTTAGHWPLSILRILISEQKGPSTSPKCCRNGNLRATCITHHYLTSTCIYACPTPSSLSKLTFCGNGGRGGIEGDVVTMDTTMTEADFSGKKLGAAGTQILAAFMSTKLFKAKGSLVSLNLANNCLKAEGAKAVAVMLTVRQNRTVAFC